MKKELFKKNPFFSDERPFSCEYCPAAFRQLGTLNEHVKRRHVDGKNIICDQCSYRTTNLRDLEEHKR